MATPIEHNVRIIHLMTGEHVICNFTQIREEDKFVAYQMLYPLTLTLSQDPNQFDFAAGSLSIIDCKKSFISICQLDKNN